MNDNDKSKLKRKKGFFYYVPGPTGGTVPDDLKYALPAGTTAANMMSGGPDGGGGFVHSDHAVAAPGDYAAIEYVKMPGLPYWLGVAPSAGPPGPDDLVRDEIIDGYPAELAGGHWVIPLARVWPEGTKIPSTMGYGPDGEFVTEPVARYAAICRKAERIFQALAAEYGLVEPSDDIPPIDDGKEGFDLAVEILAVNYRVGPAEVSRLALIDTAVLSTVIGYMVDLPRIYVAADQRQTQKKTDTGGSDAASTPDGVPD